MGVNPGVQFEDIRANVENDAIPYVEAGTGTYAHLELRDTVGVPQQADGGARMFIALRWSSGMGRVASTTLRVFIEDEEGDGVDIDRSWRLGDLTSNVLAPKLWISLMFGSDPAAETYQASVDDLALLAPYIAGHGAERTRRAYLWRPTMTHRRCPAERPTRRTSPISNTGATTAGARSPIR